MKIRPLSFDYHAEATTRLLEMQQGQPKRTLWILPSATEGSNDDDETTDVDESESEQELPPESLGESTRTPGPNHSKPAATTNKDSTAFGVTPSPSILPSSTGANKSNAGAATSGHIAEECSSTHHDTFAGSVQTPFVKSHGDNNAFSPTLGDNNDMADDDDDDEPSRFSSFHRHDGTGDTEMEEIVEKQQEEHDTEMPDADQDTKKHGVDGTSPVDSSKCETKVNIVLFERS